MADPPAVDVRVEVLDAMLATGDLFVVPTTTQGTYGGHWERLLDELGLHPTVESLKLGEIRTLAVPLRRRFQFVALAATIDARNASTYTIHQIGLRLAQFAVGHDGLSIVSPVLGAGVGGLTVRESVEALLAGFSSVRDVNASLRIITLDSRAELEASESVGRWLVRTHSEDASSDSSGGNIGEQVPAPKAVTQAQIDPLEYEDTDVAGFHALAPRILAQPAADTVPDQDVSTRDRLGIARDVEMLASVVLATETPLPLAIGLFGEWGSGKSFFMAALAEHIAALADAADKGDPEAEGFCGNVRQITFNAWHYADANLWASLASTIFDGLSDASFEERRDAVDALGVAAQEHTKRSKAVEDARTKLLAEVETANSPTSIVASAVPAAIEVVRQHRDLPDQLKSLADGAVPDAAQNFLNAYDSAVDAGQKGRLVGRLTIEEFHNHQRGTIATLVVTAALAAVALAFGASTWASAMLPVLGIAAPTLTAVARLLALTRNARRGRERRVADARVELEQAEAAEQRAAEVVAAREADLRRLSDRGERLHDLIKSASAAYSAELGTVSRLRRDFQALADLLAPSRSSAIAENEGLRGAATDILDARAVNTERIVLYIDDLDRCPADVVVKVLQAINMLLTFKLFVVIVGVDGRWLERSLTAHYDTLLAHPTEYLEKIIQLPFALRPMGPEAATDLMDELTKPTPRLLGRSSGSGAAPSAMDEIDTIIGAGPEPRQGAGPEGVHEDDEVELVILPPPERLVISEAERTLLGVLAQLVPTPRATKRVLNSYRMLKVCAGSREVESFGPERREYEVVIVLLALLLGNDSAGAAFEAVMAADVDESIWQVIQETTTSTSPAADSESLVRLLKSELRELVSVVDVGTYQRWVPLVSRFTYRLSAVIPATSTSI